MSFIKSMLIVVICMAIVFKYSTGISFECEVTDICDTSSQAADVHDSVASVYDYLSDGQWYSMLKYSAGALQI